jgi:hypothetical protein
MAEANDNKVRDVKDLPLSGDVVVLASIPLISNARDQRRRRLVFTSWAAAYTVALLVVGSVVVSAVK